VNKSGFSRRRFIGASGSFLGVGLGLAHGSLAQASTVDPTVGRERVFDDNFDSIDWSIWNAGPKPTTAEPGFYGASAFARRGGEEGFDPYVIVDDDRATGGKALQISAKYIGRTMSVPNYYGNMDSKYQWISGNLQTAARDGIVAKGWRKGYFEVRMLFPKHPLSWPAFWLLNGRSILNPGTSIELDVVEHKGWEPTLYGAYLHEWGQPGEHHEGTGVATNLDMTQEYCRYGILVDDTRCIPYFERKPVVDTRTGSPANWPINRSADLNLDGDVFFPLLTLALHNDVPQQGLKPDELLTQMRVDYFQVYQ
jgi:beta-glucanase (GH16 family)